MEKTALSRLKMHELAKSVGVIDYPESQWKWALRQLRDKNRLNAKNGNIMLSGDMLEEGKQRIGLRPFSERKATAEMSKKYDHKREVVYTGQNNDIVIGDSNGVNIRKGDKALIHTHPTTPLSEIVDRKNKRIKAIEGLSGNDKEYYSKYLPEYDRELGPISLASPSGMNYNHLSKDRVRNLTSRIERKSRKFVDENDKLLSEKERDLYSQITGLEVKGYSPFSNLLTFGNKSYPVEFIDKEKGKTRPYYFGDDSKKALKKIFEHNSILKDIKQRQGVEDIDRANLLLKWHNESPSGGDAAHYIKGNFTGNIMGDSVTGVHSPRENLPKGFRSVFFTGGYKDLAE